LNPFPQLQQDIPREMLHPTELRGLIFAAWLQPSIKSVEAGFAFMKETDLKSVEYITPNQL